MSVPYAMIRHDKKDPLSGLTLRRYRHNSGFELSFLPKPGFARKYLGILVPVGAANLRFRAPGEEAMREVPPGTAHLLEHVIFRRGAKDDPETSLLARLSSMGIEADAYATHSHILFYFTCVESLLGGLKVLYESVLHPNFDPENIEIERRVIEHEMKLFFDKPRNLMHHRLLKNLYRRHPVRYDIAGTPESLARITKDDVEALHRTFFTQHQLRMLVIGDVEEGALLDQVVPLLDDLGPGPLPEKGTPDTEAGVAATLEELETASTSPMFAIGWKDPAVSPASPVNGAALRMRQLAGDLFFETLIGPSSDLYEQLYQENIIDESLEFRYVCERDCAYLTVSGTAVDPERTVEALATRLPRWVKEHALNEAAFESQRRSFLGDFIRSIDHIESCGAEAVRAATCHQDLFDLPQLFERVELERTADTMSFITSDDVRSAVTVWPTGTRPASRAQ